MLRSSAVADEHALLDLAVATGLFNPESADTLLGHILVELHAGQLGSGHTTLVCVSDADGLPEGWVYFAPDQYADSVWNLWWIGVLPRVQRKGVGRTLLAAVEARVAEAGGRLLVIETSALPALNPSRAFYRHFGYSECGLIPDFYSDGDDKVILVKRLGTPNADVAA